MVLGVAARPSVGGSTLGGMTGGEALTMLQARMMSALLNHHDSITGTCQERVRLAMCTMLVLCVAWCWLGTRACSSKRSSGVAAAYRVVLAMSLRVRLPCARSCLCIAHHHCAPPPNCDHRKRSPCGRIPYTLHPTIYAIPSIQNAGLTRYTTHPTPCTLHPAPFAQVAQGLLRESAAAVSESTRVAAALLPRLLCRLCQEQRAGGHQQWNG